MREAQIKAALIDALFADGFIDQETIVISELPVKSWSRRADLVLANGRLLGFEIKSKFDKIDRLAAQLDAYTDALEGVSIVIAEKHLKGALEIAHENVGVFVIQEADTNVSISLIRKPKIKLLTQQAAIQLMLVPDLKTLLSEQGLEVGKNNGRQFMENEVQKLPLATIREAALYSIKKRYSKYHKAFIDERSLCNSSLCALGELRRPAWDKHNADKFKLSIAGALGVVEKGINTKNVMPPSIIPRRIPH